MASIKDLKRMCNNYSECKNCPMSRYQCAPANLPDIADDIVDKWVAEHPVKTYAMDFYEKFPNAPKESNGTPAVCWSGIYGKISKKPWEILNCEMPCEDCWNREMEGDNNA